MPQRSGALEALPPVAAQALKKLGENLGIARRRRRESQREWASRLDISIPTLIRMERGDPSVSAGVYVTALWMIGRAQMLPTLAEPKEDLGALELDIRKAMTRRGGAGIRRRGSGG